jgi:hypothetical protein
MVPGVQDHGNTITYGLGRWVRMHDAWVLWVGHGMICTLLTRRMVHVWQYWMYGHG